MKAALFVVACICIYFLSTKFKFFTHLSQKTEFIRVPDYPIEDLILKRWSSRAFSGESISEKELKTLFEAARWAPSSYNYQPWRFLYVQKDSPDWNSFFDLLVDFNKQWAKNAAALVLVLSKKKPNGEISRTYSFDTGAAVENLALQATALNLIAHTLEGFDYDRAKKELSIPDDFEIQAMIAIGKPGSKKALPEFLQEKEVMSDRKPIDQIAFEGRLPKNA